MSEYEKLFAEILEEMERPLPLTCAKRGWPVSKGCRLAGGCQICFAEVLDRKPTRRIKETRT